MARWTKKAFRWQDSVEAVLWAVLLALIIRTFVVTGYRVPTSTMAPSLLPGDFIFSYRPPYGFKIPLSSTKFGAQLPKRGDLVVFTFPDQPRVNYVKRVIALPGDLVEIKNGELVINEEPLTYRKVEQGVSGVDAEPLEDWRQNFEIWVEKAPEGERQILRPKGAELKNFGPISVPQDEVFLLGDNRETSDDSRYWGTVPFQRIEGRVFLIWLSLEWSSPQAWPRIRWGRTGQLIDRQIDH